MNERRRILTAKLQVLEESWRNWVWHEQICQHIKASRNPCAWGGSCAPKAPSVSYSQRRQPPLPGPGLLLLPGPAESGEYKSPEGAGSSAQRKFPLPAAPRAEKGSSSGATIRHTAADEAQFSIDSSDSDDEGPVQIRNQRQGGDPEDMGKGGFSTGVAERSAQAAQAASAAASAALEAAATRELDLGRNRMRSRLLRNKEQRS